MIDNKAYRRIAQELDIEQYNENEKSIGLKKIIAEADDNINYLIGYLTVSISEESMELLKKTSDLLSSVYTKL